MIIFLAIFLTTVFAQAKRIDIEISTTTSTDRETQAQTTNVLPEDDFANGEGEDIHSVNSVTARLLLTDNNGETSVISVPIYKSATISVTDTLSQESNDASTALYSEVLAMTTKNTAEVNIATTENYNALTENGLPKEHVAATTSVSDLKPINIEQVMTLPKHDSATFGRARKTLHIVREYKEQADLVDDDLKRKHRHKKQRVKPDPSTEIEDIKKDKEEFYVDQTMEPFIKEIIESNTTLKNYTSHGIKKYVFKKKLPTYLTSDERRNYLYSLYGGKDEYYKNLKNSKNKEGIWSVKSVIRSQKSIEEDQTHSIPLFKYSWNLAFNPNNYLEPNEVKKNTTELINSPREKQNNFHQRVRYQTVRTTRRYHDAIIKGKKKATHRFRLPKSMTTPYSRKRTVEIPLHEEETDLTESPEVTEVTTSIPTTDVLSDEMSDVISDIKIFEQATTSTTAADSLDSFIRPLIKTPTVKTTPMPRDPMAMGFYFPNSDEALFPRNYMTLNRKKTYLSAITDILARNNRRPYIDSRERDNYILSLYAGKNKKVKLKKRPKLKFLKKYGLRTHFDKSEIMSDVFGREKPKHGKLDKLFRLLKDLNRLQGLLSSNEETIESSNEVLTNQTLKDSEENSPNTKTEIHYKKNSKHNPINLLNVQDTIRVQSNNQNKVSLYMNVLKDFILDDNKALKQYDWLTTTVQIQSILSKTLELIKRMRQSEPIHSVDRQVLRHIVFLHNLFVEIKEDNKLDNELTKIIKLLPRIKKKRKIKLLQEIDLIKREMLYLRRLLPDEVEEKMFSQLFDFFMKVQDGLFDLHEAIRHIAEVTKFDRQNWYNNLKQLYLSADKKHLRELLLHISMSRLVDLVEHSCKHALDHDFVQLLKTKKKDVKRIVEEMLFIDKILDEI